MIFAEVTRSCGLLRKCAIPRSVMKTKQLFAGILVGTVGKKVSSEAEMVSGWDDDLFLGICARIRRKS